jgi:hypothetical protein
MEAARPAEGTKAPTSSASSSISLDAMHDALAYLAAFTLVAWGLIHVAPTRQVITSMEPSTKRQPAGHLTQEWIVEALGMWGLATLSSPPSSRYSWAPASLDPARPISELKRVAAPYP